MCGFVGRLNFDGAPVARETIEVMRDLQVHRGPDAAGLWIDGPVGLGFRRLAIIDLSSCGEQPMGNEDGSIVIAFNGEIYNFKELRQELVSKGHRFRSHSDTEVILHMYEECGTRVVERLRGMFAFAIWDSKKRRLVIARDRVGKKPLFYHMDSRGISFSSEVRSLFADPRVPRTPDYTAIHHYLTYQYVPSPWSAFKGVRCLPPASVMVVDARGESTIERYWKLQYADKIAVTEDEAIERVTELVMEATRLRMVADVPLGAFLSGGVDSSVVVAAMATQSSEPVRTFTIGFREQKYNEAPFARTVAERYGTEHTELTVEPDAIHVLPKLVWHYGNPFADSSAIPSFYVAELTRRFVTVALNGDGGDESFGGYERYAMFMAMRRWDLVPASIRDRVRTMVPPLRTVPAAPLTRKAHRAGELLLGGPEARYAEFMAYFSARDKAALYTPEFLERTRGADSVELLRAAWGEVRATDDVDRLLGSDVAMYLPDDLLVKVDIATMASSLEARSPLLDHRLMEYAASLPVDLKVRAGETKYLLKKVAERLIPREVIYRPKMGFAVPVNEWFRGELAGYVRDVLLDDAAMDRGLFTRAGVEGLLQEHSSGRADHGYRIYALLMLELWFRTYIDRSPLDGPLG